MGVSKNSGTPKWMYQSHGSNGISSDISTWDDFHQGRLANRLRAATLNRARLGKNSSCFLVIFLGHRISTNDENGRLFSPLLGDMIQFDRHIFQMGWNHQLEMGVYFVLLMATRNPAEFFKPLGITPWKLVVSQSYREGYVNLQEGKLLFPLPSMYGAPLKFNMEPEKKSLEKDIPFGNHHFQVPC